MQKEFDRFLHYVVSMPSFSLQGPEGSQQFEGSSKGAWLDTGTPSTLLPKDAVQKIYEQFGVTIITEPQPTPVVNCSLLETDAKLTFNFGESGTIPISVPLSDFIIQTELPSAGPACIFMISANEASGCGGSGASGGSNITCPAPPGQRRAKRTPQTNGSPNNQIQSGVPGPIIIGANVLSAMYVVFDLENNQIGMAPASFNATTPNIKPILPGQPLPGTTQ